MIADNLNELKNAVAELEEDIIKVNEGVKARITKARKKLQTIKKLAQAIRVELQEKKKEPKADSKPEAIETPKIEQPAEQTLEGQ